MKWNSPAALFAFRPPRFGVAAGLPAFPLVGVGFSLGSRLPERVERVLAAGASWAELCD